MWLLSWVQHVQQYQIPLKKGLPREILDGPKVAQMFVITLTAFFLQIDTYGIDFWGFF